MRGDPRAAGTLETVRLRRHVALSCALAALASAPAQAQEPPPPQGSLESRQIIAPGVKAGGIDLGGQSVEQASQTLELSLRELVERPVLVRSAGREFTLAAADAGV